MDPLAAAGIICVQMDVTDDLGVREAVKKVLQEHHHIDVLVNNAGVQRVGPIAEVPLETINEILQTNVVGAVRMVQAVVPSMAARHRGLIVNIGSVTSQVTTPFAGAYSASKAALRSLSTALEMELAPLGIYSTYIMA